MEKSQIALNECIKYRGLELSEDKTKIVHLSSALRFFWSFSVSAPAQLPRLELDGNYTKPSKKICAEGSGARQEWLKTEWSQLIVISSIPIIRDKQTTFCIGASSPYYSLVRISDVSDNTDIKPCTQLKAGNGVTSILGRLNLDRQKILKFGNKQTGRHPLKFLLNRKTHPSQAQILPRRPISQNNTGSIGVG